MLVNKLISKDKFMYIIFMSLSFKIIKIRVQ